MTIYMKFGKKSTGEEQLAHHTAAVEVLVDLIRDLERAKEFAERVNAKQVWSKLARAQLDSQLITESIQSYIKAKDPTDYHMVPTHPSPPFYILLSSTPFSSPDLLHNIPLPYPLSPTRSSLPRRLWTITKIWCPTSKWPARTSRNRSWTLN